MPPSYGGSAASYPYRFGGTGRAGCEPVAGRDAPEDRLQRGDQGEKGEGERGDQLRGI